MIYPAEGTPLATSPSTIFKGAPNPNAARLFFSWLHGFRKLRFVTEKDLDMQFAFLDLALALICYRYLKGSFC